MAAESVASIAISRIRFCDKNTVDVAQLRSEMDGFLNRISALFLQRKAGHIHSYTRHVSRHQKSQSEKYEILAASRLVNFCF